MVVSPFYQSSAKKNGCLGFQVCIYNIHIHNLYIYIFVYTHMSLIEQSNPFPFFQLYWLLFPPGTLHISSPARLDSTIWTFPGAMATEQGTVVISRLTKWLGAVMHTLQQLSSLSNDVLVWNCLPKKNTQNGSKLAACVRLSYFVSKVLKFGGLKPGRNLYGFWVDPWFRASKNTSKLLNTGLAAGKSIAENSAGKLKGGNFVRKSSAHRNFQDNSGATILKI